MSTPSTAGEAEEATGLSSAYVDDLVITGTTPDEIARFKEEMKMQFKMADFGLLSF
jgi:hypothetical protein